MQFIREANYPSIRPPLMAVLLIALLAVSLALISIFLAGFEADKALLAAAVLGGGLVVTVVLLLSKNPLPHIGALLLMAFPIVGHLVPPGRLNLDVFDLMSFFSAIAVIAGVARHGRQAVVSGRLFWFPFLLLLAPVAGSIDRVFSFYTWTLILLTYPAALAVISYGKSHINGLERISMLLAVAVIVIAVAVMFEKATGINLSGYELNLNAIDDNGFYRAAGFFQDPQKAGQFLACLLTFFVILLNRGACPRGSAKILAIAAIALGFASLILTVSRAAMLTAIAAIFVSFFFHKKKAVRYFVMPALIVIAFAAIMYGATVPLPESVAHRLQYLGTSTVDRLGIWQDSWHIFLDYPILGIGPGNYQELSMHEDFYLRMMHASGDYVPSQPENGYLKILYEGGMVAAIAFSVFLAGVIRMVWRARKIPEPYKSYAIGAAAALSVFGVTFATLFTVSDGRNLLLAVALVAILILADTHSSQPPIGEKCDNNRPPLRSLA